MTSGSAKDGTLSRCSHRGITDTLITLGEWNGNEKGILFYSSICRDWAAVIFGGASVCVNGWRE